MNVHAWQSSASRMLENLRSSTSWSEKNRVIVSDIAGTTRDAIDTEHHS